MSQLLSHIVVFVLYYKLSSAQILRLADIVHKLTLKQMEMNIFRHLKKKEKVGETKVKLKNYSKIKKSLENSF